MGRKRLLNEVQTNVATIGLIRAAGILKEIRRSGWVKKADIEDAESVADHSYRVAFLAMVLGAEMRLDSSKLVRMCLLHDLAESKIGDKMPEEKPSETSHRKKEDLLVRRLIGGLPRKSKLVLLSDWKELIASKTQESRLAWEIDKLEMLLQQRDYIRKGHDRKKLSEFEESLKVLRPALRKLVDKYSAS